MCTKLKVWKPGQLVAIDHKVYRVVKSSFACVNCENRYTDASDTPCVICIEHRATKLALALNLTNNIALKELKPKQNK